MQESEGHHLPTVRRGLDGPLAPSATGRGSGPSQPSEHLAPGHPAQGGCSSAPAPPLPCAGWQVMVPPSRSLGELHPGIASKHCPG